MDLGRFQYQIWHEALESEKELKRVQDLCVQVCWRDQKMHGDLGGRRLGVFGCEGSYSRGFGG